MRGRIHDSESSARNAAALLRLDVNRPPLTPGLVLEMFRTHQRFSTAAENRKWNENALSKSRARFGRLHGGKCRAAARRVSPRHDRSASKSKAAVRRDG